MTRTYKVTRLFSISDFAQGLTNEINSKWAYNAICTNENLLDRKITVSVNGIKYLIRILFKNNTITIYTKNSGTLSHIAATTAASVLCLFSGSKNMTHSLELCTRRHYKNLGKYKEQLDNIVSVYSSNYFKKKEV